jgi:hypothetical protein
MSQFKSEPPDAPRNIPNLRMDEDDDGETRIFRPEASGVHSQIRDVQTHLGDKPLIDETKAFRPPPELIAAAKARRNAKGGIQSDPPPALIIPAQPARGLQDDNTQVQQVPKELIYQARRVRAARVRQKQESDPPPVVGSAPPSPPRPIAPPVPTARISSPPRPASKAPPPPRITEAAREVREASASFLFEAQRVEAVKVASVRPPPIAEDMEPTRFISTRPTSQAVESVKPSAPQMDQEAEAPRAESEGRFLWICAAFFMAYLVIVGAGVIL